MNETDPSGDCVKVWFVCVGGGPETSSVSLGFHPLAGLEAWANIGRGATFGLTNTIDNWISPGSSCLLAGNSFDELLGETGTSIVGGELLSGLLRSQTVADWAYGNGWLGPDSSLFGNSTLGNEADEGLLNQRGSSWKLGWSVNGRVSPIVPGFRLETPFSDTHYWLWLTSHF